MIAQPVGISISYMEGSAVYIPVGHRTGEKQVEMEWIKDALGPVLADPTIRIIGQNIKYDWIVALRHGLVLDGIHFDTMIGSYLINPSWRQHNLDKLALEYLRFKKIATEQLLGKKDPTTMDLIPMENVAEYATEDADITFRLYTTLSKELDTRNLHKLFEEIEMPLVKILVDMQMTGIRIDTERLKALSEILDQKIKEVTEEIYIMADEEFNINSTQQLSEILFNKLNYPVKGIKKTKSGYSTAEGELRKLASQGGLFQELPMKILEYRGLTKLQNTYVLTLPAMENPQTGRIHSSFNQTVTETGRLSSSDPNLQNIPVRTELGREIRRAFIPSEGNIMVSADYSQMELRILAHIARDQAMLDAFRNDLDIHAATASKLFNVPVENVSPEQRRRAKMVNFGIDYGMTPYGLSDRLGISLAEARDYINRYLAQFSGVARYIEDIKKHVSREGWVETLLGRRRPIPLAKAKSKFVREGAFRQAINMPIQGTSADIIKIAMINIFNNLAQTGLKSKMILQVHDELIFDVPAGEEKQVMKLIKQEMENAWPLDIPLKVDVRSGANWDEVH